jgi:hypothetical protein
MADVKTWPTPDPITAVKHDLTPAADGAVTPAGILAEVITF